MTVSPRDADGQPARPWTQRQITHLVAWTLSLGMWVGFGLGFIVRSFTS